MNDDTLHEIAAATQQPGKIIVLDGRAGTSIFEYVFGTSLDQRGDRVAKLYSIDGNSTAEFIGSCRDGRIKCFSGGPNNPIGIKHISDNLPKQFKLYQNYPNPFNPTTKIKYDIPDVGGRHACQVQVSIYDILGRKVAILLNENLSSGSYQIEFDGTNYASGIYFYKITAGSYTNIKKMVLLK